MAANTFGEIFRLTTFGESHGSAIGGIIDGCPPNLVIDEAIIQKDLDRRRPGQSHLASPRNELDKIQLLSGVFEGKSTGAPIAFIVPNTDQRSNDYSHIKHTYRPSHADFTYQQKYGIRDYRGGGRSSARETIARVVAGSIAKSFLETVGITLHAYVQQIGQIKLEKPIHTIDFNLVEQSIVRCPDVETTNGMQQLIEHMKLKGDTLGGVIGCVIKGVAPGLGAPVFDKFHADLGKAMLSINAVKGFDYGSGFEGVSLPGSLQNDQFVHEGGKISTLTNHSGGIQGGITNGQAIYFRVAFKPVATLMQPQQSVDDEGNEIEIAGKGRHDVCVLPRAVPIVEAMAALTTIDHYLRQKIYNF